MTGLRRLARAVPSAAMRLPPVAVGGIVAGVAPDHVRVLGLANHAIAGERVRFANGGFGEIVRIEPEGALVRPYEAVRTPLGAAAFLAGPLLVSPGPGWLGRVLDATGTPIDGGMPPPPEGRARFVDGPPEPALARGRLEVPARTGIKVVDLFTPLVHGQRMGVFAGSGVGKSTFVSMIARAPGFDAVVVALVGERGREVRGVLEGPLAPPRDRSVLVVATADESPMKRRLAPRTAVTIAEALAEGGRRVLLVVDSLTRYAHALREIALGAGEPPVSRGYPPSVFTEIPRLMERVGPGRTGSGSVTAAVSVLVDGDDHNDPVADTARGILDGHIVLDRQIAESGRYPAVDVLKSLSRLADLVWTAEQRMLVARLRALIATYEDTRDLRLLAGDGARRDPEIEQAAELVPRIYRALAQAPQDEPSKDVYADLAKLIRPG